MIVDIASVLPALQKKDKKTKVAFNCLIDAYLFGKKFTDWVDNHANEGDWQKAIEDMAGMKLPAIGALYTLKRREQLKNEKT